ncbi:hypothetical protein C8Q76DRAFT_786244 [Earliella scabrosa]|nr:hypothetical protein C8Q76DRAFT_786244 [Earliella scabrosa]
MRSLGILPREDNEPPSQTHHPEPHHTSSSSLEQSSKSTPRPHQHHEHKAQQHEHKALKIIPAIAMAITLILLLIILGCYCVLRKRRLRRGAQEDTASAASFDLARSVASDEESPPPYASPSSYGSEWGRRTSLKSSDVPKLPPYGYTAHEPQLPCDDDAPGCGEDGSSICHTEDKAHLRRTPSVPFKLSG